jgi:hypothetical protein
MQANGLSVLLCLVRPTVFSEGAQTSICNFLFILQIFKNFKKID